MRPPMKRWMDEGLIEKHYRAREEAEAAEERRRLAAVAGMPMKLAAQLDVQVREREEARKVAKVLEKVGWSSQADTP